MLVGPADAAVVVGVWLLVGLVVATWADDEVEEKVVGAAGATLFTALEAGAVAEADAELVHGLQYALRSFWRVWPI